MGNDPELQGNSALRLRELPSSKRGVSRRTMVIWLAGIASAELLASGITWPTLLHRFQGLFSKAAPLVEQAGGHAFFVSSERVSLSSNAGIADQLEISLRNIPPPLCWQKILCLAVE